VILIELLKSFESQLTAHQSARNFQKIFMQYSVHTINITLQIMWPCFVHYLTVTVGPIPGKLGGCVKQWTTNIDTLWDVLEVKLKRLLMEL